MSKHLAVVGSPISHSKSPAIHSAAYSVLAKDYDYTKIQVEKNHLMKFVETLDGDWLGLSVTAPLKAEALRLASWADETATLAGGANTLLRTKEGWSAFNTDVYGIQRSLAEAKVVEVATASVIGTGATSISAVIALVKSFPDVKLLLAGRNKSALNELKDFAKSTGVRQVSTVSTKAALSRADLVVCTLPAKALDTEIVRLNKSLFAKPRGVLFDVAYEPWPSAAANLWADAGLSVISGIEMLLWQAIAQVRIFVEGNPEAELFNEAAVMLAMRNSIGLI